MSLYETFETDIIKETKGIVINIGTNKDGSIPAFRVAHNSKRNKKYNKVMKELAEPYQAEMDLGTLDEELAESMLLKGFVRGCLKGWENVNGRKNKPIPYNEANALKLLTDLPYLLDKLQMESSKMSNFLVAKLEADAKN